LGTSPQKGKTERQKQADQGKPPAGRWTTRVKNVRTCSSGESGQEPKKKKKKKKTVAAVPLRIHWLLGRGSSIPLDFRGLATEADYPSPNHTERGLESAWAREERTSGEGCPQVRSRNDGPGPRKEGRKGVGKGK